MLSSNKLICFFSVVKHMFVIILTFILLLFMKCKVYGAPSLTIATTNFKLQLRLVENTLALWVYVDESDEGTNFKKLCSKSPASMSTPSGSRWK